VRATRHDIGVFLDLAAALAADETPSVTDTVAARLSYTGGYIADAAERAPFQAWVRNRFAPALNALGLPGPVGDSDDRHSRRATLLSLVGVTGNDTDLQRRARDLATEYITDPASLAPTLAPTVLQVAAVSGDRALYDQYVAQLEARANQPEEYYRFFAALSWFSDPALTTRTLEFAVSPAVRTQDTGTLIGGLLSRPWSRDAAWAFTKAQWRTLTQKLGTFQGIPAIISAVGGFCSSSAAADVRAFFAANPVPSAERTLQQSLERIESCAAVDAQQSRPFAAWLEAAAN
jgi:puromycin-sensitive aminopeptidase